MNKTRVGMIALTALLSATGLCAADGAAGPRRIQVRPGDSLENARDRLRQLSPSVCAHGVDVVLEPRRRRREPEPRKGVPHLSQRRVRHAGLDARGGVALLRGNGLKNVRFQDLELARSYAPVADFGNADSVEFRNCRGDFRLRPGSPVAK